MVEPLAGDGESRGFDAWTGIGATSPGFHLDDGDGRNDPVVSTARSACRAQFLGYLVWAMPARDACLASGIATFRRRSGLYWSGSRRSSRGGVGVSKRPGSYL